MKFRKNSDKIKPNYVTVINFDLLIDPMLWDILSEFQAPTTRILSYCNILILEIDHFQYNIKHEKIMISGHMNIYFKEHNLY